MKSYLVLLGPPGAGKGTQAKMIADQLKIPHISTGDILRESVRADSSLGREVKAVMDKGDLVSDGLLKEIVKERLALDDCRNGFLLDGYPRNIPQSETLEEMMCGKSLWEKIFALEISVPDDEIVQRLKNRRSCPECGRVFNMISNPPANDETCDDCSVKLVQRDDDREETVRQRLSVYHKKTEPVMSFFKDRNKLICVSGGGSPEQVLKDVMERL